MSSLDKPQVMCTPTFPSHAFECLLGSQCFQWFQLLLVPEVNGAMSTQGMTYSCFHLPSQMSQWGRKCRQYRQLMTGLPSWPSWPLGRGSQWAPVVAMPASRFLHLLTPAQPPPLPCSLPWTLISAAHAEKWDHVSSGVSLRQWLWREC